MVKRKEAVIVLGHGSREKQAKSAFLKTVALIGKRLNPLRIEPAFFQFSSQNLSRALKVLDKEGHIKIIILPLFLFRGVHVNKDIPELLSEEKKKFPGLNIALASSLWPDERIADIAAERINAMLEERSPGKEIEKRSFQIIEKRLGGLSLSEVEKGITKRVAHATADLGFARRLIFHPQAAKAGLAAIKMGRNIVTDVEMVRAGIYTEGLKRFGGKSICLLNDEDVVRIAKKQRLTRAMASIRKAVSFMEGGIVAIGNAPTALFELCDLVKRDKAKPALIVGIPVGFVGAAESKKRLRTLKIPYITNQGRKGGSSVAVAIVNALLKIANSKYKEIK